MCAAYWSACAATSPHGPSTASAACKLPSVEALLLVVFVCGGWIVYRNTQQERALVRGEMQVEWPGVLALTPEGRDVYATVVLRALGDEAEPDIDVVTELIELAEEEAFEESASSETHRHHATYMTAFYQRVAVATVMGADPYRADEESMIDEALAQLAEARAVPRRRRGLARRAMATLVGSCLVAKSAHGEGQLRRGLETLEATLTELERLSRPRSW